MSRISQNFFLAPNYLSNIKMLYYTHYYCLVSEEKINKDIQNLLMNSLYYCFYSCGDFYYVYVFRHPSYDFCTTLPNNKLNESYSKFIRQQEVQRVRFFSCNCMAMLFKYKNCLDRCQVHSKIRQSCAVSLHFTPQMT